MKLKSILVSTALIFGCTLTAYASSYTFENADYCQCKSTKNGSLYCSANSNKTITPVTLFEYNKSKNSENRITSFKTNQITTVKSQNPNPKYSLSYYGLSYSTINNLNPKKINYIVSFYITSISNHPIFTPITINTSEYKNFNPSTCQL